MKTKYPPKLVGHLLDEYCRQNYSYDPDTGVVTGLRYGKPVGRPNHDGYITFHIRGKHMCAHRIGWFLHFGRWPQKMLDHINRNPADNRVLNLREADFDGNARNRKQHPSASGFKGVWKRPGGWGARINDDQGKHKWLGTYETAEAAARAYDVAALKYYGDFAATNQALGLLNWNTEPKTQVAA